MIQEISRFGFKTVVHYGVGSTELTGGEASKTGISKAMIITDRGVRQAGLLDGVEHSLTKNKVKYEVFDEVEEDADINVMHRITLQIKKTGCDGIIVVGGGSPICAAKGAALEVTNEVADVRAFDGVNKARIPPLPVICLPTTAGSGSDVSAGFPVLDFEHQRHFGISGENVPPRVSILDPLLLKTCPRLPMIFAGIDALSHALEALWSIRSTVLTDALAFEAIRLIMTNLRTATFTDNLAAKMGQQLGCTLAMNTGDNAGLGIVHALAGVYFNLKGSHGYKCGIFLPHAMEFNTPFCEQKFAHIATMAGESACHKSTSELALLFVRQVKLLLIDLDFPKKFESANLSSEKIPEVIKEARKNHPRFLDHNIRKVTDEDIAHICQASLKSWDLV
jgi:alcohol dehydrogenase class IV